MPTVLGDKCRFRSQRIFVFPFISKIICFLETEGELNSYFRIIGLYNALKEIEYLSDANEAEVIVEEPEEYVEPQEVEEVFDGDVEVNTGLNKALDTYRKLIEKNEA